MRTNQDYDGGRSGGSSFRDESSTRRGYDEYDAGEFDENPRRADPVRNRTSVSSSPTSSVPRSAVRQQSGNSVGTSVTAKPVSTPSTSVDLLGGFEDEPASVPVVAPPPASTSAPASNAFDGQFSYLFISDPNLSKSHDR